MQALFGGSPSRNELAAREVQFIRMTQTTPFSVFAENILQTVPIHPKKFSNPAGLMLVQQVVQRKRPADNPDDHLTWAII